MTKPPMELPLVAGEWEMEDAKHLCVCDVSVSEFSDDEAKANLAFLARAANSYAKMREALEVALKTLRNLGPVNGPMHGKAIAQAEAALKAAKGE